MPDKIGWQWFAVGSAFFAGLTAIHGKVGVSEINSNLATFIRVLVILPIYALLLTWLQEWEPLGNISRKGALFLVLSGIATGLSWLCYYRALKMADASRVAPIDKLSVVFVIILAYLVLGEKIGWRVLVGGSFVVAGVLILSMGQDGDSTKKEDEQVPKLKSSIPGDETRTSIQE